MSKFKQKFASTCKGNRENRIIESLSAKLFQWKISRLILTHKRILWFQFDFEYILSFSDLMGVKSDASQPCCPSSLLFFADGDGRCWFSSPRNKPFCRLCALRCIKNNFQTLKLWQRDDKNEYLLSMMFALNLWSERRVCHKGEWKQRNTFSTDYLKKYTLFWGC